MRVAKCSPGNQGKVKIHFEERKIHEKTVKVRGK